ncbi:hypothetical protein Hanom_Chr01g00083781 [Helianthus anomalus]
MKLIYVYRFLLLLVLASTLAKSITGDTYMEMTKKSEFCSADVPWSNVPCDDLKCNKFCFFARGIGAFGKCTSPTICHCRGPCQ